MYTLDRTVVTETVWERKARQARNAELPRYRGSVEKPTPRTYIIVLPGGTREKYIITGSKASCDDDAAKYAAFRGGSVE